MLRSFLIAAITLVIGFSCTRPEQRSARYEKLACPICANVTNGTCSYCSGSTKCIYCKGQKDRTVVSPNIMENPAIKPFTYKEPCQYCKNTGTCTYCNGTGKCWACAGTGKVADSWQCLNSKQPSTR